MEPSAYIEMYNNEDHHWWFVGRRTIIRKILDHYFKSKSNRDILEAGCGTGGNLAMLSNYGTVYGFELDDYARGMAQGRNITDVRNGYLPEGIPFEQDFDLICLLDVLEHIDDDKGTVASLFGKLKPSGKLLLTVPAYQFLWSAHDLANHHKRRYVRHRLLKLLRDAGFTITYASYFNTILFPIVLFTRIVNNILNRNSESDVAMPSEAVNRMLAKLFGSERSLMPMIRYPFGVSILVLATRPATESTVNGPRR